MTIAKKMLFPLLKSAYRIIGGSKITGKFKFLQKPYFLIVKTLRPEFVQVGSHKIYLDEMDALKLSFFGEYDINETKLIEDSLRPGDVVLDIGANIGYYSLTAAKIVGDSGKVYAFEPDPLNFALLQKNIECNNYKNIIAVQKAVSNSSEDITLFLSKENRADHRCYATDETRESVSIKATSIDEFFKEKIDDIKVDFIKIDIQGYETQAFEGMMNLLSKQKSTKIITEFWPFGIKNAGGDPKKMLEIISHLGFAFQYLQKYAGDDSNRFIDIALEDLIHFCDSNSEDFDFYLNLFCVKTNDN
jgi:FkbM family methyltransferase